jgi:hypothetical protein
VGISLTAFHHISGVEFFNGSRFDCCRSNTLEAASLVRLDLRHVLALGLTGRMNVQSAELKAV